MVSSASFIFEDVEMHLQMCKAEEGSYCLECSNPMSISFGGKGLNEDGIAIIVVGNDEVLVA